MRLDSADCESCELCVVFLGGRLGGRAMCGCCMFVVFLGEAMCELGMTICELWVGVPGIT